MILTADSDGLFFNQTFITSDVLLAVDTANTPIASVKLAVDRNLIGNGSLYFDLLYDYYNHQYYSSIYDPYIYDRKMANFRVDVNDQTVEKFGNFLISTFNFSNTTKCSNGTHTFLLVSINTYLMNITGEHQTFLQAKIGNQLMGDLYASLIVGATINNGNFPPAPLPQTYYYYNVSFTGCNGDHLSYEFSTGECVETCPCGTSPWYGSCQKSKLILARHYSSFMFL